ncbi:MAG: hypothetical protein JXB03_07750 [Spirochaetales bacterium]|nr:hypothetical protein [Spirochaetales bacterium]
MPIKETVQTLVVSALIGLGVGGLFGYLYTGSFIPGITEGAIAGLCIGFVSRIGFMLVYLPLRRYPVIAFITAALIIAAGTIGFCLFWGLPFPIPGILVLIVSEIIGITATAVLFLTYSKLNNQLEEKKRKLLDKCQQ